MRVVVCPRALTHQVYWLTAMAEGIGRHGHIVEITETPGGCRTCDVIVTWGLPSPALRNIAERSLVMEAPYFWGPRGREPLQMASAGWEGLNGRATFNDGASPSDRWELYGREPAQWSPRPGPVVVLGQCPGDKGHAHVDLDAFYHDVVAEARESGTVLFRHHPKGQWPDLPCFTQDGTLEDALSIAKAVLTFNSNAAVEAVLAGVPAIVYDRGSMAWDVASHDVAEKLRYPDRTQWSYNLAYCQWTHEEMADGTAWEHLCSLPE